MPEALITIFQHTRRRKPENVNLHQRHCENLRSGHIVNMFSSVWSSYVVQYNNNVGCERYPKCHHRRNRLASEGSISDSAMSVDKGVEATPKMNSC
jgi:hypothetical protein